MRILSYMNKEIYNKYDIRGECKENGIQNITIPAGNTISVAIVMLKIVVSEEMQRCAFYERPLDT